jgi:hypothetical protein
MALTIPVYQGYFGYARFNNWVGDGTSLDDQYLRAKNIGIKASQTVETEDLVDTRYDKTVYRLGPRIVEGPIDFPVAFEPSGSGTVSGSTVVSVNGLWDAALNRDSTTGALTTSFDVECNYAGSGTVFNYTGCQINTFNFKVVESGTVDLSLGIIGLDREVPVSSSSGPVYPTRNTRLATWNDARVGLTVGDGNEITLNDTLVLNGCYIREFSITINNNIQRFYSLDHHLAPIAITATKRDITGTVRVLGRNNAIGDQAATNEDRCYEDSRVGFGYVLPSGCGTQFQKSFTGVIYEFEEIALSPALFETTVNFKILPGAPQSDFPVPDSPSLSIPSISTSGDCVSS